MDTVLRLARRYPPRSGWMVFSLALGTLLMLPAMLDSSPLDLRAGPMLGAVIAGLVFGVAGHRWRRILLIVPAILMPLLLLELVPSWRIIAADVRTLFTWPRTEQPVLLGPATGAAASETAGTLRAAWDGDPIALNWAIAHLAALLGYCTAGVLGLGLRRDTPLLPWAMPLLAALATTGIIVRASSTYVVAGIVLTLLLSVIGGFTSRERIWKRENVDYPDGLRWEVAGAAAVLLIVVSTIGLVTPAAQRNPLTRWVWQQIHLPQGLARLDHLLSSDGGAAQVRLGTPGPGEQLELGYSLEVGNRENVALTVHAAQLPSGMTPYWRGRVFAHYTGRGWTTGPLRLVAAEPLVATEPLTDLVRQEITDLHADRKVRYGVPDIVAIDQPALQEQSENGSSFGWIGVEPAQTYTVFSYLPQPQSANFTDPRVTDQAMDMYLAVPDTLPARVIALTEQLTDGAPSQTERARAIERYLRDLPYSYQVAPLAPDGDAVDQFLFTMRTGYCTYYASAMAMMARIAGIPSRVAVGYASGSYVADRDMFVVREGDAHAWPELYIDGQGWTRWEPTPIRPLLNASVPLEQPRTPAAQSPRPTPAARATIEWLGVALALLMLFAIGVWAARRSFPMTPARVHHELFRYGRRAGVPSTPNMSVQVYADRLAHMAPAAHASIARVAALLTARLYRQVPLSPNEERDLINAWYAARRILQRTRGNQR